MLGQLIEQARGGEAGFYLLFGGQGAGWLEELRVDFAEPTLRPLVDRCLQAIREELPYLVPGVALPKGFDVEAWLTNPSNIPSPEYLWYSGVSVPLIFITQLVTVQRFCTQFRVELPELLCYTRGISGQSQGLFAACLHALGGSGSALQAAISTFTKYVFYVGARAQETYPFVEPTNEEVERSAAVNTWRSTRPTPMVAVIDAPQAELEQWLRRFNSKFPPDRRVQVGLTFLANRVVLTGHRRSLIEFNTWHQRDFAELAIKYVYIRTTCPFHSRLMEPIRPLVEADFARIAFRHAGSDLRVPVYSFHDGRNLQADEEIATRLYLDALINPLDWRLALQPAVADSRITHVIDFGPGAENRHISRQVLDSLGCSKPVIAGRRAR
jgi:malonyl CoA-acyl carrier protein transacylase